MICTPRKCDVFTDTVNPDLGQCAPFRLKLDCNQIPEVLPNQDDDEIEFNPDWDPPYRINSPIQDETGTNITDQDDIPILGPTI